MQRSCAKHKSDFMDFSSLARAPAFVAIEIASLKKINVQSELSMQNSCNVTHQLATIGNDAKLNLMDTNIFGFVEVFHFF